MIHLLKVYIHQKHSQPFRNALMKLMLMQNLLTLNLLILELKKMHTSGTAMLVNHHVQLHISLTIFVSLQIVVLKRMVFIMVTNKITNLTPLPFIKRILNMFASKNSIVIHVKKMMIVGIWTNFV